MSVRSNEAGFFGSLQAREGPPLAPPSPTGKEAKEKSKIKNVASMKTSVKGENGNT